MNELFQTETSWCGTEAAYAAFVAENKHFLASNPTAPQAAYGTVDREEPPRLFTKQGDVGVVSIQGSLVNSSSWINEYLGRSGYPEIRDALIHAATDPNIKAIVLDVKSGGGMVAGVTDTANLIATIDSKVKPVYTYSDSMMASAAYWLGSAARDVAVGSVAEIGSVGVLVVHQENSKMLEDAGIKTTVIRSGKYKALGLSAEKLSDLGKEVIQAQVDQMNEMFVAQVADARGMTSAEFDRKAGQGRVFIGEDAVGVGLADSVTTFDAYMSKITRGIDSQKNLPKYGANSPKGSQLKTALTEQQIAALAAGAVAQMAATGATQTEAEKAAEVAAAEAAQAAAKAEADKAASEEQTTEQPAAETKPANADVVALLQTQLATAQAQVVSLSVELQGAKSAAEASVAAAEKMRPIVRSAVGNLRVALGGTAAGVEALADDGLMAEHANLSAQFTKKFPVGGVAAVSSTATTEGSVDEVGEARRQARLAAVRNTTKPQSK